MNKSLTAKETVIVNSGTGVIVARYGDATLREALVAYAGEIDADPETIKTTYFGLRLVVPGKGDFRATYR